MPHTMPVPPPAEEREAIAAWIRGEPLCACRREIVERALADNWHGLLLDAYAAHDPAPSFEREAQS